MSKKVFVDLHHQGLYKSLQFLFENRLGMELFRPIGTEWNSEGYWTIAKIYGDHPSTIEQYLGMREAELVGEYYEVEDQKAVTFDQFKVMKFDYVIASYIHNVPPYKKLVEKYQPQAKLIAQLGNEWPMDLVYPYCKSLLASVAPFDTPPDVKAVFYHQEFDLDIFKPTEIKPNNEIRSFVNCLQTDQLYKKDWRDFTDLEKLLPDYKFYSHGSSTRDGVILTEEKIAELMKQSKWGLQLKTGGDGFGHVLHDWFAIGRPVIYRGSQYKGKLGEKLLTHFVTGIDIDKIPLDQVALDITNMPDDVYQNMCKACRDRFKSVVDYQKETEEIKKFLERLI